MDKLFHNDAVLRILALILACAIWLGVNAPNGNTSSGAGLSQPYAFVVKVEVPQGMVATRVEPSFADVIVTGSGANVANVQAAMANVTVVADATNLSAGTHVVPLKLENMPNLSHTVDPKSVSVTVKAIETAALPVQVHIVGHLDPGYLEGTPKFESQSATVSGSTRAISKVTGVEARVWMGGKSSTFTENVPLIAVDSQGNRVEGVTVTPGYVTVTLPINARKTQVNLVPQVVGNPAPGYAVAGISLEPTVAIVQGVAPKPSVGKKAANLMVPVNVSAMMNSSAVNVVIPLMDGMIQVEPSTILAKVTLEPSATRTLINIPVQSGRAPKGEIVHIQSPKTIAVSISGPESIIRQIRRSDIVAAADFSNVTKGDIIAPINVVVPNWVNVNQMSTNQVSITVSSKPAS